MKELSELNARELLIHAANNTDSISMDKGLHSLDMLISDAVVNMIRDGHDVGDAYCSTCLFVKRAKELGYGAS